VTRLLSAEAACGCQGNQVESAIKRYGNKDVRWSAQGMLRLMPAAMQRLYRPTLDAINDAVSRILDDKSIQGTYIIWSWQCIPTVSRVSLSVVITGCIVLVSCVFHDLSNFVTICC